MRLRKGTFLQRTKGSCRFADYYKLEWLDTTIGAYRPLQKRFASLLEARTACQASKSWRIYKVSESGRSVVL